MSSTDGIRPDTQAEHGHQRCGRAGPEAASITNLVATGGKFYTTKNCALSALLPNTACINGTVRLNANGSQQFPYNTLAGSLDRKSLDLSATYDLTDGLAIFMDGFYSKRTSQQIASVGAAAGSQLSNGTYPGFLHPGELSGQPVPARHSSPT